MGNIYKEGQNLKQQMFFPPSIDEYVSEENPVRAIDAYVEILFLVPIVPMGTHTPLQTTIKLKIATIIADRV